MLSRMSLPSRIALGLAVLAAAVLVAVPLDDETVVLSAGDDTVEATTLDCERPVTKVFGSIDSPGVLGDLATFSQARAQAACTAKAGQRVAGALALVAAVAVGVALSGWAARPREVST